jgi:hypothetical protein
MTRDTNPDSQGDIGSRQSSTFLFPDFFNGISGAGKNLGNALD